MRQVVLIFFTLWLSLSLFFCRRGKEAEGLAGIGRGLLPVDSLQALYSYLQKRSDFAAETLRFWVLTEWIEALIDKNDLDTAQQLGRVLDSLVLRTSYAVAPALRGLGWGMIFRGLGKPDPADSLLAQAFHISDSLGRIDLLGKISYERGLVAIRQKKLPKAIEFLQQAVLYAQQKGDSLLAGRSTLRMGVLYGGQGRHSEAESLYRRAVSFLQSGADPEGLMGTYINLGLLYDNSGRYPEALGVLDTAYHLADSFHSRTGLIKAANNLGLVHYNQGNYSEALQYFQIALQHQEALQDTPGLARSYNNIGGIYFDQRKFKEARKYYQKALFIRKALSDEVGMASIYSNIGSTYHEEGRLDSALQAFLTAAELLSRHPDTVRLAYTYNNLGNLYIDIGNYGKALEYLQKSADLYRRLNDKKSLTYTYANMATLYWSQGQPKIARMYAQKAFELARALNAKERIMMTALVLAKIDSTLAAGGQLDAWRSAYFSHYWYAAYKDSLFNEENIRKIERLQAQYEHEKQVALLRAQQEKERALTAARLRQKELERNYSLFGLGLTLAALTAIAYFLLILRRKNQMLTTLNNELELSNAELAATNKALEASNETIRAQAEALAEKNEHILAGIRYAKRIQNAILPAPHRWQRLLRNSFIWYMPKEIVAGDFYWLEETDDYIFVGIADATGHGVPGAFVSLMCSSALSKALLEEGLTSPAPLLDRVKEIVVERLTHEGEKLWDGMDIALLRLSKTQPYQITFAGANRPLWLITRQNELIEIPPTRQPIGYTDYTIPFEETTLSLESQAPVMIYAFTDGLTDQIGGPQSRKLGPKRLREFLLSIAPMPLSEQLTALQAFYNNWKKDHPQTDDVTCLGLRIT